MIIDKLLVVEKSTSTQTYEKTNTENNDGMDYIKSDN